MSLNKPSLTLFPSWQKERLSLVRTTDAVRLCREGRHEQLSRQRSLAQLLGAGRKLVAEAREFIVQARLLSRSLADCSDELIYARLHKLIEVGTLVVVRESAEGAKKETPSLVKQRRAISALARSRRSTLKYEGRSYRLVADADLTSVPDRDDYMVVGKTEANRVLSGLAKLDTPEQAGQLIEARNLLTRDWRPPFSPDGIILLERIPVRPGMPKSEAPMGKPRQTSRGAAEAAPADEKEEEACRPCAEQSEQNQAAVLIQASAVGKAFCALCASVKGSASAKVSVKASFKLSF